MKTKKITLVLILSCVIFGCKDQEKTIYEPPRVDNVKVLQSSELSKLSDDLDKFNQDFERKNSTKLRGFSWGRFFKNLWHVVSSDAVGGIESYMENGSVTNALLSGAVSSVKAAKDIDWSSFVVNDSEKRDNISVFSQFLTTDCSNDSIKLINEEIEEIGKLHNEIILRMVKNDADIIKQPDSVIVSKVALMFNEIIQERKGLQKSSVVNQFLDVDMRKPINVKDFELPLSTYSNISYSSNVLHPERRGPYNKHNLAEDLDFTMSSMFEKKDFENYILKNSLERESQNEFKKSLEEMSKISAGHISTLCNIENISDVESYAKEYNDIVEKSDIKENEKKTLKLISSVAANSAILWSKVLNHKNID